MAAHRGDLGVIDETHRIGHPGVLGLGTVVVVGHAVLVEHHVLEHAAEADRVPDLRLALFGQLDALGVAAALDVEDAVVGPAVLVVADEPAIGIGGKRGLAGSGESEEECDVGGVLLVDVARAVHREDVEVGQVVVHRVEDRLLHLTGVSGAEDDDLPLLETLDDREIVLHPVLLGVLDLEVARVVDDPVGFEAVQLVLLGIDEEGLREQAVPGFLGEDRDLESVLGVGARLAVEAEEFLATAEVLDGEGFEFGEILGGDRLVHLAPVDVVVDAGCVLEELVTGAAPGALSGVAHQGSVCSKHTFTPLDHGFEKPGYGEVAVNLDAAKIGDSRLGCGGHLGGGSVLNWPKGKL